MAKNSIEKSLYAAPEGIPVNKEPDLAIEIEISNFSEVRDLTKNFNVICSTLCEKIKSINERLEDIEVKNESKQ